MRLFVAVTPPAPWRAGLIGLQEALRGAVRGRALRWVRPEGIHLTLRFLGEIDPGRVPALEEALTRAAREGRALRLEAAGLGGFGGPRRLRVVWLGLGGDLQALAALAAAVDRHLADCGVASPSRPFRPHLTLARVRDGTPAAERGRIQAILDGAAAPALEPWTVAGIELIRSHLGAGGARYETLGSWSLAPG